MNAPTPSNNIDTELDRIVLAPAHWQYDDYQEARRQIKQLITADRNKLIKHLAFYYGLPEAEMRKVVEGAK